MEHICTVGGYLQMFAMVAGLIPLKTGYLKIYIYIHTHIVFMYIYISLSLSGNNVPGR